MHKKGHPVTIGRGLGALLGPKAPEAAFVSII
jgi:hypothetical protein